MKKYVTGLLAICIAIFLSSFSMTNESQQSTGLFWYPVSGGVTTTDQYVFEGSEEGAKTIDCSDSQSQPVCLFGSENDQLPVETTVPTGDPSVIIRETEN